MWLGTVTCLGLLPGWDAYCCHACRCVIITILRENTSPSTAHALVQVPLYLLNMSDAQAVLKLQETGMSHGFMCLTYDA